MIIGGKTWPHDRKWVIAIVAVSVLAVAAYAVEWSTVGTIPGGSSHSGFLYGIAGGLIIVFELLLWPRKYVRSWRIGSAQTWLRDAGAAPLLVIFYLGLLATDILLHIILRCPLPGETHVPD